MMTLPASPSAMRKGAKWIVAAITALLLVALSGTLVACNSAAAPAYSPEEVVTQHLTAKKKNDIEAWIGTLTADYDFSRDTRLGVTSLEIIEVKAETDSRYMEEALQGEVALKNGWTKGNLAFVSAVYDVQHDNTLVPYDNGRMEYVFKLVRPDGNSRWLIRDWGPARFR
jgi:hypothetical protein